MINKTLVIQIKYGGLGDHLFYSHIPRIAKETGAYNKVFISNLSEYRHPDYKRLIWDMNPYLDGYSDDFGICYPTIGTVKSGENMLDRIMLQLGIDDGKRFHEPELYYRPELKPELFDKVVYDPNYVSYVGNFHAMDISYLFEKEKIHVDYQMKLRETNMALTHVTNNIHTPSLEEFCSVVVSCKKLYCLASGTATLAAALKKPATVFYGEGQGKIFHHSKKHTYIFVPEVLSKNILQKIIYNLKNLKGYIFTSLGAITRSYISKTILKEPYLFVKQRIFFYNHPSAKKYKISYSQSGEDLIVKFIFDRLEIERPSYIAIGTNNPYSASNTALFYLNGSRGINIEPDEKLFNDFIKERPQDINLNCGIAAKDCEIDLYILSEPAPKTFLKTEADYYVEQGYQIISMQKKQAFALQTIINKYCNGIFPQFLSLDAEGLDEAIIRSINFEQSAPLVICIEATSFSTTHGGFKNLAITEFLTQKGYVLYANTNINYIFVSKDFWEH